MTTLFSDIANLIAPFAHYVSGGQSGMEDAIRNYRAGGSKDITETGAGVEITVVAKTQEACFVTAARFVPETTVGAGANTRDCQLEYDDGAGGSPTTLATLWDGTASGTTGGQVEELAGVEDTIEVPAGSRIYMNCTHNGTGAAWNETMFEVDIKRA